MPISTNPITPSARDGFRSALSLPDDTLRSLGVWVNDNLEVLISGDIPEQSVKLLAGQLKIGKSDVGRALSLALTFIMNSERSGEIDSELVKELGIEDLAPKLKMLLSRVDRPVEKVVGLRQSNVFSNSVVPTLSDVDILCDLRAIFRSFPSGSTSESHSTDVKSLLGFEPIVIVNLELNDSSGNDRPAIFQLSEAGLRNLIKTLEESLSQLEIVKKELPRLSPRG